MAKKATKASGADAEETRIAALKAAQDQAREATEQLKKANARIAILETDLRTARTQLAEAKAAAAAALEPPAAPPSEAASAPNVKRYV